MAGHGLDARLPAPLAEARDLLRRVRRRPPHARALREDLDGVAADLLDPVDRLRDASGCGDMGAEEHAAYATAAMSVRVRMAPSPTGLLHIGGVRTFLFNWLFARGRGGECLLRIENTDTSREVAESVEQIERSLRWLGIEWDGETTFQLDVMERAKEEARRLVDEGTAYEDDGAIRIRMPDEGSTGWDDAIKGRIEVPNAELEDVVLVRSDGRPTYNFASPLEDWLDGITHVIRGDDHVSNTPKQINVLRALGAEPPVYAHVPSVFGADGKKLSKRHGAVSVDEFRAAGYVPEALMNFLALLGWAPDGETTIMSRDELVERFSLERVGSSPATFDYAKLDWMNGVYLRALPPDEYAARLVGYLREQGLDWPEERVRAAAPIVQEKIGRFGEFPASPGSCSTTSSPTRRSSTRGSSSAAAEALGGVEPWTAEAIESALKQLCDDLGEKPRTVYLPIRVAVTGSRVSPGLYESLELLGRDDVARAASSGSGRRRRERPPRSRRTSSSARRRGSTSRRSGSTRSRRRPSDPQWIHVDPGAGGRRAVRNDDRARLPDALALRPDALRGAAPEGRVGGELRHEPRPLPGARSVGKPRSAGGSAFSRSTRYGLGWRATHRGDGRVRRCREAGLRRRARRPDSVLTPSMRALYDMSATVRRPHAPPSPRFVALLALAALLAGVFVATAAALWRSATTAARTRQPCRPPTGSSEPLISHILRAMPGGGNGPPYTSPA